MEVTWDEKKATTNKKKRGITFEEAATVLLDPNALTFADDSASEERFLTIGYSAIQRILIVVWCDRDGKIIRIISARKATKQERKTYEEGI